MTSLSRPLFRYFGSKWQLSKHYPAPLYDVLRDHLCGSACYACRHPERQVILTDVDPDIVLLLKWLTEVDPTEILSLPVDLTPGMDIRELEISRGAQELIRRWQRVGRNDCWTVSKWNGLPGLWQESVKRELAKNVLRIRHWEVYQQSYTDSQDDERTHFVDAPYQHVKGYPFESIDFGHLGEWCRTRRGQVIVCEQAGADWLPFEPFRSIAGHTAASRKPGSKSHEVIWTNRPTTNQDRQLNIYSRITGTV